MSGLAIFVAAAAIVSVVVISATIANQVSDEFDALRATSVSVRPTKDIPPHKQIFPPNAEQRLQTIPGVVAGGVVVTSTKVKPKVATSNADPTGQTEAQLIGVDHSVLQATDATIDGIYEPVAFETGAKVAYIGDTLATELGVTPPTPDDVDLSIVTINGLAFQVLGVLLAHHSVSQRQRTLW
ncbi:MAG: ABC transporter permease [Microthrixaceae bacterium]